MVEILDHQRIASVDTEIHSKGSCYAAEDVTRRQLLVIAQRMINVQKVIEEECGESISLASLFESATMKLRKGKTGSFRVIKLAPSDVPRYLDERRAHFGKLIIATSNADKWRLQTVC